MRLRHPALAGHDRPAHGAFCRLAADASISATALNFVVGENEANALSVVLASGTYTLTDRGPSVTVTAGAGCAQVAAAQAVQVRYKRR